MMRRLEARAADLEKQSAIERTELQQQLQQERRQQEREVAKVKAFAAAERQQLEATLRDEYTARYAAAAAAAVAAVAAAAAVVVVAAAVVAAAAAAAATFKSQADFHEETLQRKT
ncbi:hypothetical protein EPH_0062550 [Eimeria praecox]|uniref:Uncharacterized protein n=1 Tax=Eimeria praecox TaxID=51316 RepID=U6H1A7_9EIME|nr:hypothetical protein EPH_0062550 [Eimeria praecox]